MRLLHITRDYPPRSAGGISTAVEGLVGALAEDGHSVLVLSYDAWRPRSRQRPCDDEGRPPESRPDLPANPHVLRVADRAAAAAAEAVAERFEPELVHVHDATLWEESAALRARLARPSVYTAHVVHAASQTAIAVSRPPRSVAAEAAALAQASAVTTPSAAARDALSRTTEGSDAGTAPVVLPFGIGDHAAAQAAVAARRSGRTGADGPILSLGRFATIKGTEVWLAAMERLAAARPSLRFVVAGGLPLSPRSSEAWAERFRQATDRVEIRDWLEPAERDRALAEAALLVVPSLFETFSLVCLEAQLFATPVVASDSGGPRELLEDGATGRLCAVGDHEALADAVGCALDDYEGARRMALAGAESLRASGLWRSRLPGFLDLYRSLATR